jgi:hypothetical protein
VILPPTTYSPTPYSPPTTTVSPTPYVPASPYVPAETKPTSDLTATSTAPPVTSDSGFITPDYPTTWDTSAMPPIDVSIPIPTVTMPGSGMFGVPWKFWGIGAVVAVGGYMLMNSNMMKSNRRRMRRNRRRR